MTFKKKNKTKKNYKKKPIIGILTAPVKKEFDHIALSYLYKSYIQWAKIGGNNSSYEASAWSWAS